MLQFFVVVVVDSRNHYYLPSQLYSLINLDLLFSFFFFSFFLLLPQRRENYWKAQINKSNEYNYVRIKKSKSIKTDLLEFGERISKNKNKKLELMLGTRPYNKYKVSEIRWKQLLIVKIKKF